VGVSLARMFLSGLLVAGGIILGAFTLHGYLDPDWQQKQAQAAKAREQTSDSKSSNTFQPRERFVVGRNEPATPEPKPPVAKPAPKPDPAATADAKPAPKPVVPKKKAADKPADKTAQPQPQQAAFQWPWQKLFGNN
jgi:hypothetical protein